MHQIDIVDYFPPRIAASIRGIPLDRVEEIRIRVGNMIEIRTNSKECFVPCEGPKPLITPEDCHMFLENICFHSVYACENQLRSGYITLPGGSRVGLGGKILIEKEHILRVETPLFFCIRIAREYIGCSKNAMCFLVDENNRPQSTLIISPPGCGKTTLLRDIARGFSYGCDGIPSRCVCVIDERSEIAGCWNGIPQLDLGPRCDVLDNCPKPEGIMLALRSLAPNVIVCDELGCDADCIAVINALSSGCAVYTTLHGNSLTAFETRFPKYAKNLFSRFLVLSRERGPGTIDGIYDRSGRLICKTC